MLTLVSELKMTLSVPQIDTLDKILPDEPLLMMGAGPVPIPDKVARANSIVINHLGETMAKVIDQVKSMSRYVFQTESKWIMGVAGPGSAAMEMAVANLVWTDTKVLSVVNGFFSSRLTEMAIRAGADVQQYQVGERQEADPQKFEEHLKAFRPEVITIVQGETSNTVHNSQLEALAAIAKDYGCYVIVDAVCTLSTMPLKMDEWKLDAIITGGQKGLSSIPGVSLVAFSDFAWQRIISRQTRLPHWCLDAQLAQKFWHGASYHYTAPVSGILALHEALRLVCEETLPSRFNRHRRCSESLQQAIEVMGLDLFIPAQNRLNSVVGIELPKHLSPKQVTEHISTNYGVEISGSFGPNIVRIGQMGEQSRVNNLFRTLHALGCTMRDLGVTVNIPAAMAALEENLQDFSR